MQFGPFNKVGIIETNITVEKIDYDGKKIKCSYLFTMKFGLLANFLVLLSLRPGRLVVQLEQSSCFCSNASRIPSGMLLGSSHVFSLVAYPIHLTKYSYCVL